MAAGTAAGRGLDVTIIERNKRMARKLTITGKGRCNITNNCDVDEFIANLPRNGKFIYSALSRFSPRDLMAFFEKNGVSLKTERGNRVFPVSDRAVEIVDALVSFSRKSGCRFKNGRAVSLIISGGRCKGVRLDSGEEILADAVIICTGGMSYPLTGSTGDGYVMARQAGHTVTPLRPSLVPLVSEDGWCGEAQGLSLRNCAVSVEDTIENRIIYQDFGEILFTHFGVSGPIALSASAHMDGMRPGRYRLLIDLKPALTEEQLDLRLIRDFELNKNRDFANSLDNLLPRSLCPVIVSLSGIPPKTKCHSITRERRRGLGALLKSLPVTIRGFRPIDEAIITSGGVKTSEINSKTMESKIVKGLYFAGEVIDVDGYTGGFNLQIAFSTGAAAGRSVLGD